MDDIVDEVQVLGDDPNRNDQTTAELIAVEQTNGHAAAGRAPSVALGHADPALRLGTRASVATFDIICLSHLRWDFVYQRPQHLMSRWAPERRVFFVEEPELGDGPPRLDIRTRADGVRVVIPRLPVGTGPAEADRAQRTLLDELLEDRAIQDYVLWYYTPMALGFTDHLRPVATVYDCMDELSAFAFAPPAMHAREAELIERADLLFTGGQSLYEAKRGRHPRVYAFPSSVDLDHFCRAREPLAEPPDQATVARPRLGYFGVIDERMDLDLLAGLAKARPDWQIVMVGPHIKVDPATLPRYRNIHYLGPKRYEDLPSYLAGWDVALLPFALNESTRFISPTKTPEYLAGGKPVVSTPIRDVVRPYGQGGLVRIADGADAFVRAVTAALAEDADARLALVDPFLEQTSWDGTWQRMRELLLASPSVSETAAVTQRGVTADPTP